MRDSCIAFPSSITEVHFGLETPLHMTERVRPAFRFRLNPMTVRCNELVHTLGTSRLPFTLAALLLIYQAITELRTFNRLSQLRPNWVRRQDFIVITQL